MSTQRGIGHAARLVPIAHQLHQLGHKVFICSHGQAKILMEVECPYATFTDDIPFEITYGRTGITTHLKFFLKLPNFLFTVWREHILLQRLVKKHQIDGIISDNRYGMFHEQIPTAIITHQINIANALHVRWPSQIAGYYIKKFDECWIPDMENNHLALAGKLSRAGHLKNFRYMGFLSRARTVQSAGNDENTKIILFLLSGPEPMRTLLENKICEITAHESVNAILVRGTNCDNKRLNKSLFLKCYDMATIHTLESFMGAVDVVVCRAGYSTLMDLVKWRKTALLIPTPGQSEQEYLAHYLHKKGWFSCVKQEDLSFTDVVNARAFNYPVDDCCFTSSAFMDSFLNRILVLKSTNRDAS